MVVISPGMDFESGGVGSCSLRTRRVCDDVKGYVTVTVTPSQYTSAGSQLSDRTTYHHVQCSSSFYIATFIYACMYSILNVLCPN